MAKAKAVVKKSVKVIGVKAKVAPVKVKVKTVKTKAVKAVVAPKKVVKKKAVKRNPNGTYTIHMRDQLAGLHEEAKKRGMQTSVFVRECILYFVKKCPVKDKPEVA